MASNKVDLPPHRLILALQYYAEDEARALRVARLIADIEPSRREDVILVLFRRVDCEESAEARRTVLYCNAKMVTFALRSEWEGVGHPAGCNALWQGVMDELSARWAEGDLRAHSVFTMEPDGVPLRKNWLDAIIAAHTQTLAIGKRVTGAEMLRIPHVNGSLVAHLSLWHDRPSLHVTPPAQAWDLFHAATLMAEARTTRVILNVYGACRWSPEALKALSTETAYLCSQKDDSAMEWAERELVKR